MGELSPADYSPYPVTPADASHIGMNAIDRQIPRDSHEFAEVLQIMIVSVEGSGGN